LNYCPAPIRTRQPYGNDAIFGYDAFIIQHGEKIAALPLIAALGKNFHLGTKIEARNVLSLPRERTPIPHLARLHGVIDLCLLDRRRR